MHVPPGATGCTRWVAALSLAAGLLAAGGPAGAATVPGAPRVADPAPDPLAAWSSPGDLSARAERARLAGLQLGVPSFDAAARSVLLESSSHGAESARAAALVAADLPLAQAALASRLLRDEHDLPGAVVAAAHALASLPRHREASLWLEATGFLVLRNALFFGALALLGCVAARHARAAAHDLGDRAGRMLPLFARAALLGVLMLLPAILGQGLLGLALSCFALSLCYGTRAERRAVWAAVLLLGVGLEAGSFGAARALVALDPDPVVAAVQRVEQGFATASERIRLEQAAASDPLAARGLALLARREGRLAEAAERYEALIASQHTDASIENNAANVWMALGDVDRALPHYEQAAQPRAAALVLYNLSYGYGQAIRPRAQDETLQRLQRVDPALAFDLTQLQARLAGGFTLDLPVPEAILRARADAAPSLRILAAELRRPFAPGVLGIEPRHAGAAFLLAAAAAWVVSGRFRHSGVCSRCGGRMCPRCDGSAPGREPCAPCRRLFERPETADPDRRARRLAELESRSRRLLRVRVAVSILVPGAAGVLAERPWLGLAGALLLCLAAASLGFSTSQVADPLAAGGTGSLVFWTVAASCLAAHGALVVAALRQCVEPSA